MTKELKIPALILVVALGIAIPASKEARADILGGASAILSIPAMLPDMCFFGHCVQFTQTAALAQIQTDVAQERQLQNEAQNLASLSMTYQNVGSDLSAINGFGTTISADVKANIVAQGISDQAEQDAAEAARLNGQAAQANGNQEQQQVGNGYLSVITEDDQKQLSLSVAEYNQSQADAKTMAQAADAYTTVSNTPVITP